VGAKKGFLSVYALPAKGEDGKGADKSRERHGQSVGLDGSNHARARSKS
jgi:hypothetical protein